MTPRRTYLPSINTVACSKTEIEPVLENMNLLPGAESLTRDKIKIICLDVQYC